MKTRPLPPRNPRNRGNGKKIEKVVEKAVAEGQPPSVVETRVEQSKVESAVVGRRPTSVPSPMSNAMSRSARRRANANYKATAGGAKALSTAIQRGNILRDSESAIIASALPKSEGRMRRPDKYVMSLMLPEQYATELRYPGDKDPIATAAFLVKQNINLPLYQASYGPDFPLGGFLVWFSPSFSSPLRYMHEFPVSLQDNWKISCSKQTDRVGFFDIDGSNSGADEELEAMVLQAKQAYPGITPIAVNLVSYINIGAYDPPNLAPPFINYLNDGTVFYGYSINTTTSTSVFTGRCDWIPSSGVAHAFDLFVVDQTGVIATVQLSCDPEGVVQGTFPSTAPFAGSHLGNSMIGFRLSMVNGAPYQSNQVLFDSWTISFQWTSVADPQFNWMTQQFAGYEQASEIYRRFRVNAASVLVSWFGADVTEGGQIATRLCTGGVPAIMDGEVSDSEYMWSMTGMGDAKFGFGPNRVNKGCYTFWLPTREEDNTLRGLDHDAWDSTQIVAAGVVVNTVSTTPVNVIRLRWVVSYEATTTYQIIPTGYPPSNRSSLAIIKKLVSSRQITTSMENDLHSDIIKWSTLPLSIVQENLPIAKRVVEGLGPLASLVGFL